MKVTKEKVLRHALYIAAQYLIDEGFCSMDTVANCKRDFRKKGECEKCISEMLLCIANEEMKTLTRKAEGNG